mmetsp:Transcript_10720/g.32265  ORF Transcript_10720/g.32265 Transcript_10720/m.32265 type:complete len:286 (-) Transcript_10720:79-936(-)
MTAGLRANKICRNGVWYATLDNAVPDDTDTRGQQTDSLELPIGWRVAPNEPDVVFGVIAEHGWGTLVLVVEDGSSYWTRNSTPGKFYKPGCLLKQGNKYRPAVVDTMRVLIQTVMDTMHLESIEYAQNLGVRLWDRREFADCTLACAGEEIPCHREILSLASPVFAQMFRSGMREAQQRRVDLGEVEPVTVMAMAHFMYTGKVAMQNEGLVPLLYLADRFDIQPLARACALRLTTDHKLTTHNVVEVVRAMRPFATKDIFGTAWQELCTRVHEDPELYSTVMRHL